MKSSNINSIEFVKNMNPGDRFPIEKSFADKLTRTGRQVRSMVSWADKYQVNVDGHLCDLIYYDRGAIELQRGSDLS